METGSSKLETGSWQPEDGNWKQEAGNWKAAISVANSLATGSCKTEGNKIPSQCYAAIICCVHVRGISMDSGWTLDRCVKLV